MKTQRFLAALTVVNLLILVYQVSRVGSAESRSTAPMLRGRGMEIVDEHGRLRAELKVLPANKAVTMPNGRSEPETVILRLITADGKPRVKVTTSDDGSGLLLLGESDASYLLLDADRSAGYMKFKNGDGGEKIVKP